MKNRPIFIVTFAIAILIGFLIVAQFFSTEKIKEKVSPEHEKSLSLEVSILSDSNRNLREEISKLRTEQKDYDLVFQNKESGTEVLGSSLENYKIVSGLYELSGEGIVMKIEGPVLDVHLLDLTNTIRNIGIKGMALNDRRLVYNSSIIPDGLQIRLDGELINPPYIFKAVGDPELLQEALTREGGMVEQITQIFPDIKIDVSKKDSIALPAYGKKFVFDYARETE
ncbi:MAG: hypothetical protein ACD_63C00135G0004 [uncultured bacterium]|nr:MAG: hypothetical protein ACD_63C00135G0004 [uncultured bacterium]